MAPNVAPWTLPPFTPDTSQILCGLATANGGTIITVPAGRFWSGMVTISACALVASAGAAVSASARVSTAGTGVIPSAGDYVRLDIAAPASIAAAIGTNGEGTITAPMMVAAPSGNAVTLVLNTTNVNTASASACGLLL